MRNSIERLNIINSLTLYQERIFSKRQENIFYSKILFLCKDFNWLINDKRQKNKETKRNESWEI